MEELFKNFLPTNCLECGHKLAVIEGKNGKLKLICPNPSCDGVAVIKFQKGMLALEISGVGPAICKKLYNAGVHDTVGLLTVTSDKLIQSGEFTSGRALDKLMESIHAIKNVKLYALIESLQFENVGETISKEVEKYFCGVPYDFTGIEYAVRKQIENKDSEMMVKIQNTIDIIKTLTDIEIVFPKMITKNDSDAPIRIMEMTGSPKDFGFETKSDFVKAVEPYGIVAGSLNKDCTFLVTDDLSSMTSKMVKANKLGVQIVTYGQLFDMVNNK
jgi:NAD-dependent DNA ligase